MSEEIYEKNIDFWIDFNPKAMMNAVDNNCKLKDRLTENQWKRLCNKTYEAEHGTKNRFS